MTVRRSYGLAPLILGDDNFVPPEEIARKRGFKYSEDQLAMFEKTLPPQEVLLECRERGYLVVAGPNQTMSLADMRMFASSHFASKGGSLYEIADDALPADHRVGARWVVLRKYPVPGSTSRSWADQQALIKEDEYVPNIAEVAWAASVYRSVRNVALFREAFVRTSSQDWKGTHMSIGGFTSGGMNIIPWEDNEPNSILGIAAALKL